MMVMMMMAFVIYLIQQVRIFTEMQALHSKVSRGSPGFCKTHTQGQMLKSLEGHLAPCAVGRTSNAEEYVLMVLMKLNVLLLLVGSNSSLAPANQLSGG